MSAQASFVQWLSSCFDSAKCPPGQFSIKLYNIHENVLHLIGLVADRRYVEEIRCVGRVKAAQCTLFTTSRQFSESQNFMRNPRLKILLLMRYPAGPTPSR
jgi:hypothetical protein